MLLTILHDGSSENNPAPNINRAETEKPGLKILICSLHLLGHQGETVIYSPVSVEPLDDFSWAKNIQVGGRGCGSERDKASFLKPPVFKGHGDGPCPGLGPRSWGAEGS